MNAFLSVLNSYEEINVENALRREELKILQVNLGDLCNQSCSHCHIEASPQGKNIMTSRVIENVISFLSKNRGLILDITGGAPELNPNFEYLIEKANPFVSQIMVRSNLTVFFEPGKKHLFEFFRDNKVHLICSLPCYGRENVDKQRGGGVFEKSIQALRKFNELGFGRDKGLLLDIVYNPGGAFLPLESAALESDYKNNLRKDYNIEFNRLITITNVPIKRFKSYLEKNGQYVSYIDMLKSNFNPKVVCNIMCRTFLSVGYDGKLYDCDFNQALGWALKDELNSFLTIDKINANNIKGRKIMVGEHCLSCTAGYGSSCQGSLSSDAKK